MSLDNVLAVAGAARDHLDVLIIGFLMSVALMGAAGYIAKLWSAIAGWPISAWPSCSMSRCR